MTEKNSEKLKLPKSGMKDIPSDSPNIKEITRENYEQLYVSRLDNQDEMDRFIEL